MKRIIFSIVFIFFMASNYVNGSKPKDRTGWRNPLKFGIDFSFKTLIESIKSFEDYKVTMKQAFDIMEQASKTETTTKTEHGGVTTITSDVAFDYGKAKDI